MFTVHIDEHNDLGLRSGASPRAAASSADEDVGFKLCCRWVPAHNRPLPAACRFREGLYP